MLSTRLNKLERETVGSRVIVLIGIGRVESERHREELSKKAVDQHHKNRGRTDVSVCAMPFGD